jgi:hypothetical protein
MHQARYDCLPALMVLSGPPSRGGDRHLETSAAMRDNQPFIVV